MFLPRDNATKLYLFLDDIFQPSPMLVGVCVADDLFQSSPLESSPVQSSPVKRLLTAQNSATINISRYVYGNTLQHLT